MHLMWFRSDLRIDDNPALSAAASKGQPLLACYLHPQGQFEQHGLGQRQQRFRLECVADLSDALNEKRVPLLARRCDDFDVCIETLLDLCKAHRVSSVFANAETELNEIKRDRRASERLEAEGIKLHLFNDQTILLPGSVRTQQGDPYQVFTPFKRSWIEHAHSLDLRPLQAPRAQPATAIERTDCVELLDWVAPTDVNEQWPVGAHAAQLRLRQFVRDAIADYAEMRDFPAQAGTSTLSPYLAVGCISVRQCLYAALQANNGDWHEGSEGIRTWISELIWREFYRHLSVLNPDLSKGAAFQPHTEHLPWRDSDSDLARWQRGETGYPLVDAAMQQLNQTGWMHNRLRMVVAMFLTKHLLISWRAGEAYFMEQLIDADYASNNGGWQWSASTGADSVPYFRIFNPVRQSERFDPDGEFIRKWLPKLKPLDKKSIHWPNPDQRQSLEYADPIVDHKAAVARAKETFKNNKDKHG